MKKKKQKFLRGGYWEYSKLGLRRKKKLKYRRVDGIDNKVRLKMKGHLRNVNIGFRNNKQERGLIQGKKAVLVHNLEELKKASKENTIIIARVGNKMKMEIAKYAISNNLRILNLNSKKFLDKIEEQIKIKKEQKSKKEKKKEDKKKTEKKKEEEDKKEDKKENIESKVEEKKEAHEHKHEEKK